MMPQQTGYPGMSQMQRPMATGFAGGAPQGMGMGMGGFQQPQQTSFMQAQPTGMGVGMGGMGGSGSMLGPGGSGMLNPQQQRFLTPSPGLGGRPGGGGLMPQQTGFPQQQQQQGLMPQQTGYPGGGGLMPQQTGYPGGGMGMGGGLGPQQTGLIPQATGYPGFRDPRLQLMSSQFMPAAQPFAGAHVASNMQFSQASLQPSNFQGQIQTLSQQQQGTKEPKIPWALSKEERKSYDSIFRAWDQTSTGFISGDVAREVFGQSGLDRDRLMQIW